MVSAAWSTDCSIKVCSRSSIQNTWLDRIGDLCREETGRGRDNSFCNQTAVIDARTLVGIILAVLEQYRHLSKGGYIVGNQDKDNKRTF